MGLGSFTRNVANDNEGDDEMVDGSQLQPVSRRFGLDRGTPIDRYYIENFLKNNRSFIYGRVLEVGSNDYTLRIGEYVEQSDVLNIHPDPNVTVIGNLETGENIPSSAFDCIILTQVIQCIYDVRSAVKNAIMALKPGGTLLVTASGISQIWREEESSYVEYWRFTEHSFYKLFTEFVSQDQVRVETFGNVTAAKCFLDGYALEEMEQHVLDYHDEDYQLTLTAVVHR